MLNTFKKKNLNYFKYKTQTISVIKGFIIGSLGVVWPWKNTVYKTNTNGVFEININNEKIIADYKRYIPELNQETVVAIGYICLGIIIIAALEWYGHRNKKKA